ncbi:hypothetical protein B5K11_24240 [Rhizobium leguminosarum bv. trifolii]|nr:hypothetical protein B5K11_24240 [Rhizobium leguminosarum bv. trifolii]
MKASPVKRLYQTAEYWRLFRQAVFWPAALGAARWRLLPYCGVDRVAVYRAEKKSIDSARRKLTVATTSEAVAKATALEPI